MLVFVRWSIAFPFFALATFVTPATAEGGVISFCVGDCDGDGMVTVDELIRGINIALGNLSVDECTVFDSSGDGFVTVDEIVTAVANGLNGCPIFPTATATPTVTVATPATPTATASPETLQPVRVLVSTGAPFGSPEAIVTSLGTPIISPMGFVIVVAELTLNASETQETLLRLAETGSGSVLLAQGQQIPNSSMTVGSIAQPNAKSSGVFVFVDAENGASLLQIRDATITPVLGLGAPGTRADFESRMFVVPADGGSVVADVFAPGGNRAVVAVTLDETGGPIAIVAHDDSLSYRNNVGDLVDATVTEILSVFAAGGSGTAELGLDGSTQALLDFAFDDTMLLDRHVGPVTGNQAPGLDAGVTLQAISGARIGGVGGSVRGFRAVLSGFDPFNTATFITDPDYDPLVVVQAGAAVPEVPGAIIRDLRDPVLGMQGAALAYTLLDADEVPHAAIGFADYQTHSFRTLVVAGDEAPGGGTFTGLPLSFAINANGDLIFRGDLGGGESAYYAISTSTVGAPTRRLVGTGDVIPLPQGGSAMITTLGMIPATSGLGGEATAVGITHFTVSASLDDTQGAILLVEVGE